MPIEVYKVYKLFRFIIEGSGNKGEMIFFFTSAGTLCKVAEAYRFTSKNPFYECVSDILKVWKRRLSNINMFLRRFNLSKTNNK